MLKKPNESRRQIVNTVKIMKVDGHAGGRQAKKIPETSYFYIDYSFTETETEHSSVRFPGFFPPGFPVFGHKDEIRFLNKDAPLKIFNLPQ